MERAEEEGTGKEMGPRAPTVGDTLEAPPVEAAVSSVPPVSVAHQGNGMGGVNKGEGAKGGRWMAESKGRGGGGEKQEGRQRALHRVPGAPRGIGKTKKWCNNAHNKKECTKGERGGRTECQRTTARGHAQQGHAPALKMGPNRTPYVGCATRPLPAAAPDQLALPADGDGRSVTGGTGTGPADPASPAP